MELNKIYNESNLETIKRIDEKSVDIVLTSPFYNTNLKCGKGRTLLNTKVKKEHFHYLKYDVFIDNMSNEEYSNYCVDLFNGFDKILKENGVVLWNVNYGCENTNCMFTTIADIINKTNFSVLDVICWKKKNAIPNSTSPNSLTRIWEFIFVLCRDNELQTAYCNKRSVSKRDNGQVMYENIYNFVEAKNNDEKCPFNKATYSTDLCKRLLELYAPKNAIAYDPFMGSGTTAVDCKEMGLNYIGSEISPNQVEWANNRIANTLRQQTFDF